MKRQSIARSAGWVVVVVFCMGFLASPAAGQYLTRSGSAQVEEVDRGSTKTFGDIRCPDSGCVDPNDW